MALVYRFSIERESHLDGCIGLSSQRGQHGRLMSLDLARNSPRYTSGKRGLSWQHSPPLWKLYSQCIGTVVTRRDNWVVPIGKATAVCAENPLNADLVVVKSTEDRA
jgi:hypothetical protein